MTEPNPAEPVEPAFVLEQEVVANGGYALAAIGADVWVLDEPTFEYVLEPWRTATVARQQPPCAQNADRADYARHESASRAALADLAAWLDEEPSLALRWLSGADAQRRASLAANLADTAAAAGWRVLAAVPAPPRDGPRLAAPEPAQEPSASASASAGPAPGSVLVIVDHADQQTLTYLDWLLSNALLHQAGRRARVLLLAPDGDALPALRATLAGVQASDSWQRLSDQ